MRFFPIMKTALFQYIARNKVRNVITQIDPVCIYTRQRIPKFDCEHVVPCSFIKDKKIEKDLHNIFKCTPSINRKRQNKPFVEDMYYIHHDDITKAIIARVCMHYLYKYKPDRKSFFDKVIQKELMEEWYEIFKIEDCNLLRRDYEVYKLQGDHNDFFYS
ncbi:putative endonuclease I [Heterosigma akashiwo virus 01]|uniref:Putative endonuclease I n=1 Tax=Heterosigma akashiwo virus 01 TaxID=97195 RepID=A0A1C9C5D4_HAV01|nr:putative endonuclease I [Heterosigma akashiwo virus 01]AOM63495.1 putative endonuclease I [Heterosigma akashiwo virus 01]